MATITVQIGNTDNKLTQSEWSEFCKELSTLIGQHAAEVFFQGGSTWDAPLQNACWVCEVAPGQIEPLRAVLKPCREKFRQDSVAFTVGSTDFV